MALGNDGVISDSDELKFGTTLPVFFSAFLSGGSDGFCDSVAKSADKEGASIGSVGGGVDVENEGLKVAIIEGSLSRDDMSELFLIFEE